MLGCIPCTLSLCLLLLIQVFSLPWLDSGDMEVRNTDCSGLALTSEILGLATASCTEGSVCPLMASSVLAGWGREAADPLLRPDL